MAHFCATEKVGECWSRALVSNRDCEPEILVRFFRDSDCKFLYSCWKDSGRKIKRCKKTTNRSRKKHAWNLLMKLLWWNESMKLQHQTVKHHYVEWSAVMLLGNPIMQIKSQRKSMEIAQWTFSLSNLFTWFQTHIRSRLLLIRMSRANFLFRNVNFVPRLKFAISIQGHQ